MSVRDFFKPEEEQQIREAIIAAEKNTSGEIRVHLEKHCKEDVLDHAAYIFKTLNMHKTALRNGVLFYLSTEDHKFAILGDAGINAKVSPDFWNKIKEQMLVDFKNAKVAEGLCKGIIMAGEQLQAHFPFMKDDVNELTNDISFGEKNSLSASHKQISPAISGTGMTALLFFLFSFSLFAQDIPPRPNPPRLVNDLGNILSPEEEAQLENKLVEFNDSTGTQIVVLIVSDLAGYDRSEYAYTVGEKWGVGQKGFDNGIVILIKASGKEGERHAFIAPGYGLEGIIPDATAKEIVEYEMIPHFKSNNYYAGLDNATNVIMALARQDFPASAYTKKKKPSGKGSSWPMIIVLLIFLLFIFKRGKHRTIGNSSTPWWALLLLANSGGSHRGSFGSFTSGSGGFGGGGGFGGFGGGSFGGGGAGGSW